MNFYGFPKKQGLYDPRFEHDNCGVGFVCNINGEKSHSLVKEGINVLNRLSHRGAVGSDPKTGDGAGILLQIPHEFFLKITENLRINLPSLGNYGTGLVFLPTDPQDLEFCKSIFEKVIKEEGQSLLGWRRVPVDNSDIGDGAKHSQPVIEQVFIGKVNDKNTQLQFERKLYIIRKRIENIIINSNLKQKPFFYITNLSSRTFSYKGLLTTEQLDKFFLDLTDQDLKTSIALVHSRYSTNTFPTWDLSQPFRFLAHNGEINTLDGNINWMRAKEGLLKSGFFGEDIEKIKPVILPGGSDSAAIDNMFELLVLSGRSLAHVMMMLIPGAWQNNSLLSQEIKEFYKFHACFSEPWDGPASIAFTDGLSIGAVLDRNGLRPARYIVTKQNTVVMASEVGVLDIKPEDILISGRLEPGKMLFIDTERGCIVGDEEIKHIAAAKQPYGRWIRDNMIELSDLPSEMECPSDNQDILTLLKSFGYTREDLKIILIPMAENGNEPTGSMGNDTPHAILSNRPQLLYNYFKQRFAQVTNPAIDSIRESCVMSMDSFIGPQKNILDETPEHSHRVRVKNPILNNDDLSKIRNIKVNGFKTKEIFILFEVNEIDGFTKALDRICEESVDAIEKGYSFIILTDKGVCKDKISLPALLALGCIHQYLLRNALRSKIGIIVESGEVREVHHFALLFGYGADCVNPYLAYKVINYLIETGEMNFDYEKAVINYRQAVDKGILKILSKMGISTLESYKGAQIFEALGLHEEIIERCFTGTVSKISGADFGIIEEETVLRHSEAYLNEQVDLFNLPNGGIYKWRRDGEFHLWNPESISKLQDSTRTNDYNKFKEFSELIDNQEKNSTTLRSLFKFRFKDKSIPIEEVESAKKIMKRFATGAMSFGSISGPAHRTIAIAMNRLGGKSNTGEGGEDPARFKPFSNGDSQRSAIKQVASGRFGVNTNYLINADEIQIKIAQGAKPGEGGQLPGHKVSAVIAKTRFTTEGVTLISPPPHHDIYSIEDLAQLIFDLKNVNPKARISVKLVSENGVGTIAAGVAKGKADMILISGGDGGTGAAPMSSMKHAGFPWELGLSETHQTLVLNGLRDRVRLQTDGQMRTGRDIAIAALLGAEEFGFCTAILIVIGCVMLRHCHLNNCSLGVATQDEILEKRFNGRPEYIENYFHFVTQELREIMAQLGIRTINEMVGKTDFLEINSSILPWKAKRIDFSKIFYGSDVLGVSRTYCDKQKRADLSAVLDRELIEFSQKALNKRDPVKLELKIDNTNRAVGAMLSGEVCKAFGEDGLLNDTIYVKFKGVAGQSFGAWLAQGITFELEGIANDYVGKGISGGKIIIYPDKQSSYCSEENVIIGNTTFYGAIKGEAYIRGIAGERFCIRNSGLYAVVEGVGDHGCEYMTGGRIVVLGDTGRNFAAGMSGGIAYVYNKYDKFEAKCNLSMVVLEDLKEDDKKVISILINNHYKYTGSKIAKGIIDNFSKENKNFIKVMPLEYKRILEVKEVEEELSLLDVSD